MTSDRVDLIDEDDTWCVLLRIFKQGADTRGTDTDEHLDEIGAGDRKERHTGLTRNGFRKKRLTGTGRPDQQDTARDLSTEFRIFRRVFQKVDNFLQFLFFFFSACDVGEIPVSYTHLRITNRKQLRQPL